MKNLIFFIFMLFFCVTANADIFDKSQSNQGQITSSVESDKKSYYYQSQGLDYNLPANTTVVNLNAKANLKFGCSGYDFNTSFLKEFNAQALKADVVSQGQQIMAAAPLLLLDYASPTLADLLKHFTALANGKLGLDIMSCQQIEQAVDDKFDTMRKASEKECLNDNTAMGMSAAMDYCKNQSDPFAFLKDMSGNPLSSGGQINVVKDALQRLGISSADANKTLAVTGDTQITKGGYKDTAQLVPYDTLIQQSKDQDMTNFEDLLVATANNNGVVNDTDLQVFSRPGVQLNQQFISNLLQFPKDQRTIIVSKLAAYWAYLDTNESYRKVIDLYNASLADPNTKSVEKTIIEEKKEKVEYELTKAKDHYQELSYLKQIVASVTQDADTARANMFANVDGTQYLGVQQDQQTKHTGLIANWQ